MPENYLDPSQETPYSSAPLPVTGNEFPDGEVSEWLKEHAWKVCIRQRIGGSNPPLTAIIQALVFINPGLLFLLFFIKPLFFLLSDVTLVTQ